MDTCDICGREMTKPGATILTPPKAGLVRQMRVCDERAGDSCFEILMRSFPDERDTEIPPRGSPV